ncbi:hypothetical protein [Lysobacter arenosi]|uniref:hypothetical protein n=1 Tax=Lysobacter arenosi TaxID=2795387 RepID=UPI003CE47699
MQARQGVVPPQVALEGAATQIRALLKPAPADSVFVQSLRRKLGKVASIAPAQREALLAQAASAVGEQTNPAYARLLAPG